jgi:hypothetical protein
LNAAFANLAALQGGQAGELLHAANAAARSPPKNAPSPPEKCAS